MSSLFIVQTTNVRTKSITPGRCAPIREWQVVFALSALFLLPSLLSAQDTTRITLSEALSLASARNIDVLQAENAARSAEVRIRAARGALQPNLSLSVGPNVRYQFGSREETTGREVNHLTSGFSVGLSSGYNLYNGNADRNAVTIAEQNARSSDIALNRTLQSTGYTVIASFYEVATQRDLIAVERENLAAERQVLERVRAFVDAGTRPISDQYSEEATVAAAELRLINAQRSLEAAKISLVELLRLDPARTYDFPLPDTNALTGLPGGATATTLIAQAYTQRPEIAAQQARIEAAKLQIKVADAGNSPTVGLSASFGTSYSTGNEIDGFSSQFFSQNPSASLGLSFSLPILDRDRTATSVELAEIELQNEQLTLAGLKQQVAAEIQGAQNDLIYAQAALTTAQRQLYASERALDVEQTRYSAGISTLVELAQARAQRVSAESQVVQARNTLQLRRQTLLNAIGGFSVPRVPPQLPTE